MKFDERRELIKQSSIFTEKTKEKLLSDVELLEKTASRGSTFLSGLKSMAPHLMTIAGVTAIGGSLGYMAAKHRYEKHEEALKNSYGSLATEPKFVKDPQTFNQRFAELSLISPTVASNPRLASKILAGKLKDGFDLDDVHRLSSIEYHSAHTPKIELPSAAARARAMSSFEHAVQLLAPSAILQAATPGLTSEVKQTVKKTNENEEKKLQEVQQSLSEMNKRFKEEDARRQKENPQMASDIQKMMNDPKLKDLFSRLGQMQKKGSAELVVGEECLGRMLAEAHVMYKTAAAQSGLSKVLNSAGKFFTPSHDAMKGYFEVMAIPLAVGGGIALVKKLMKEKETADLRAQADRAFNSLRRSNEVVKGNPELAGEAYDALRSFAPSLAAKPLIQKTFIEHVINSGGMGLTPEAAQQLANTETVIKRLGEMSPGSFITGIKEPMTLFGHKFGTRKEKRGL